MKKHNNKQCESDKYEKIFIAYRQMNTVKYSEL